jgi:hypothetical protein
MAVGSFLFLQEQIKGIIITRSRRVLAGVSVHTRAYYCSSSSCKILAGGTVRAIGEHTLSHVSSNCFLREKFSRGPVCVYYCSTYYKAVREVLVLSVFKRCVYLCTLRRETEERTPTKGFGGREGFFFSHRLQCSQCKPSGAHSACMSCSSIAATVSPSIICLQS